MANGMLYIAGGKSSAIEQNKNIPLGQVIRGFGQAINVNSDAIMLNASGYYLINAMIDFESTAVGNVTIQAYKDDIPIKDAFITVTMPAANAYAATTIPFVVRVRGCCCNPVGITFVLTSADQIEILNTSAVVEKM